LTRLELKKGFKNLWFWLFLSTTLLQVFRGSLVDAIIFGSGTLMVFLSAANLLNHLHLTKPHASKYAIYTTVFVIVVALTLVPRHTPLQAIIVLAILPLALRFAWYSDRGPKDKPDERMKRSRMVWAAGGVGLMLWEFAANIFGQLDGSLHSFPTISVLIDPVLDNIFGQAVFVILWLLIGITFLRIWKKP
jgi:NAD/NADP transhydrogenase beta subunit